MGVKEVLKKIAYGKRYSSETYIDYLRRIGVRIVLYMSHPKH